MPRPPADTPPADPVWYTRHLRQRRTDLSPLVRPTVLAWLTMRRDQYADMAASLRSRQGFGGEPGAVALADLYDYYVMAINALIKIVDQPFARSAWLEAVALCVTPAAAAIAADLAGQDDAGLPE